MANERYHLVYEGFAPDTNKTVASLTLKDDFKLSDSQLADIMAGRRTVIGNNLAKEEAMKLGKELTKAGLIIKAQTLAVNQKNNPADLRKHLLEGGLDQYFASRYKHPQDETDTTISLLILAAFAAVSYLILPIIGLLIIRPLLSASVWSVQFLPAFIQLVIGLLFFLPLVWLRPRPAKLEGIELDPETEELLTRLVADVASYLTAPKITRIILVDNPVLTVHQTPSQWLKNQSTLELGLPVLEALTLQQFVGLLAMRITPLSAHFYTRTWGLFIQWYSALRQQYKPWALLLNTWVLPIHEHQIQRGVAVARSLVGVQESLRLQRIDQRFNHLNRDWPEFVEFCRTLRVKGTHWHSLVMKEAKSVKEEDKVAAQFRMESPSLWVLSTTDGYQKVFTRQENGPLFSLPGQTLWQQFQKLEPLQAYFKHHLIRPVALVPPLQGPKKSSKLNALVLNKLASDVLSLQQAMVEQALGMKAKPKKPRDLQKLIGKWRAASASFWPVNYTNSPMLPLAKSLFIALQTLQQIELWHIDERKIPAGKHAARDKQVSQLHNKWLSQIAKLPPMPLLATPSAKTLLDQLAKTTGEQPISDANAELILNLNTYWLNFLTVYWVYIAGQMIKPKTLAEESEGQAA